MHNLELLISNEQLIVKLFRAYAEHFPGEKDLWLKKAAEEEFHMCLLQTLYSGLKQSSSYVDDQKFSTKALEMSISFLEELVAKAPNATLITALSIARDIKSGLIESNFLHAIQADSQEIKDIVARIEEDNRKHREEIQQLWLKYTVK